MNTALKKLLQQRRDLWQGHQHPDKLQTLASGFTELDRVLPGNGWPLGALTELMPAIDGIGELSLLLPALVHCTRDKQWVALVAPPYSPYAPALGNAGIRLERLLIVQPGDQTLWVAEQLLRSGLFRIVALWPGKTDDCRQRRLQLAAETGMAIAACYRAARAGNEHSPAALRLALAQEPDQLRIDIVKSRHGGKAQQLMISNRRLFGVRTLH